MGRCVTYLRQRKGLASVAVVLYIVVFYAGYMFYWKPTSHLHLSVDIKSGSAWNLGLFSQGTVGAADDEGIDTDIHLEDQYFGHTGEVSGTSHQVEEIKEEDLHRFDPDPKTIAIGLGITSKGLAGADESNVASKFQLFNIFLPTFCKTASPGYRYSFYLAYDHTDPLFSLKSFIRAFRKAFDDTANRLCSKDILTSIHLVQCSHAGKPAWAQNDAMLEAYLDNVAYFYRINDDTRMLTGGWVEAFITTLSGYDPKNFGVVGPNHSGGNTAILTYDFVSQHHLRAFGFYYPRLFTDWWGDDWVTLVYRPDRSTKLNHIRLAHTLGAGQRYAVTWEVGQKLHGQVSKDKISLQRYITYQKTLAAEPAKYKKDGKKIIAISLFGRDPRYTWGAIRQAQTIAWFFPGWTFRVYVPGDSSGRPLAMKLPKSSQGEENSGSQSIMSAVRNLIFGGNGKNPTDGSSVSGSRGPFGNISNSTQPAGLGNNSVSVGHSGKGSLVSSDILNGIRMGYGNSTLNASGSGVSAQVGSFGDGLSAEVRRALVVPTRIRNKLRQLGAQIVPVPVSSGIPARLLQYSIIDDTRVETFLIRNADTRFSDREQAAVSDWLKRMEVIGESTPLVHCMRDHRLHSTNRVVEGLWGANSDHVRKALQGNSIASALSLFFSSKLSPDQHPTDVLMASRTETRIFLDGIIWPLIGGRTLCHEGHCDAGRRIPGYENFPTQRVGEEYVGRRFDGHQEPVAENLSGGSTASECDTSIISEADRATATQFISSVAEENLKKTTTVSTPTTVVAAAPSSAAAVTPAPAADVTPAPAAVVTLAPAAAPISAAVTHLNAAAGPSS